MIRWSPWSDDSKRYYGYDTRNGYQQEGPNGIVFQDDRERSPTKGRWLWAVKMPGTANVQGDAATEAEATTDAERLLEG